jgi:hypothetical protein
MAALPKGAAEADDTQDAPPEASPVVRLR